MHKVITLCRQVPMLPITIISAFPVALLWGYIPWGRSWWQFSPSLGQFVVVALVIYTVGFSVQEMLKSLKLGHVGVDILAILAILSTLAVREYWATWIVVLMIWSGQAIEQYAHSKAESNLTMLVSAAPQIAHISNIPGVGDNNSQNLRRSSANADNAGFRPVGSSQAEKVTSQTNVSSAASAMEWSRGGDGGTRSQKVTPDSRFDTVSVEFVKPGDVLVVLPGETVPVDGSLLSGSATLDLSNINGEPVPRQVFAGARIMSGAVNGSSTLMMKATQVAGNSQYQKILQLVSSARSSRAPVVKTADQLAVPFTVISLVIACAAWFVSGDPNRFTQVLVLATPCPLLIAAPVAYTAGTGRLAKTGILIKAQEILENLGRVSYVFFDKTGTLTVKKPQVIRIDIPVGNDSSVKRDFSHVTGSVRQAAGACEGLVADEDHILVLAGVIETYSVHILAKGIATAGDQAFQKLRAKEIADGTRNSCLLKDFPVVDHVIEDRGRGVTGSVDGVRVSVGKFEYVTRDMPQPVEQEKHFFPESHFGHATADEMSTFVSIDGYLAARIILKDIPRADARSSLEQLTKLGIRHLTMVTGDNEASARAIAEQVGISDVRAGLLPEDKVIAVRDVEHTVDSKHWWDFLCEPFADSTQKRAVSMMVGDGVNDAPVLTAADIGMAITDGTTTAASESAQAVIMNDDLAAVPKAIVIARQTKKVMMQAVVTGLVLAILCMIAAAANLIPVVIGALIQEGIDLVSILWALTALIDRKKV